MKVEYIIASLDYGDRCAVYQRIGLPPVNETLISTHDTFDEANEAIERYKQTDKYSERNVL